MSEIVGIDLSKYANKKISAFCDLNLSQYITKLKPIAFAANRQGEIADQANYIAVYWNDVNIL